MRTPLTTPLTTACASTRLPDDSSIRACPRCGMVQAVPPTPPSMRARCPRCRVVFRPRRARALGNSRTAAIATAALILYPVAITLPIMRVEQFGHANESSILDGTATLLSQGHWWVGLVVLVCSVILPPLKLLALLALSAGGGWLRRHHVAQTYRVVEWTGRWGMLDVLAVAVLVAVVKLGQSIDLTAGPGAAAFCLVVVLSLLAAAVFDPHAIWDDTEESP